GMRGYTSVAAGGATGMESFTSVGWTESDNFNENYLIPELRRAMPDIRWRGGKNGNLGKEAGFYMLRNTDCPAVLIEWNFMTTYDPDAKIILDPARQRTYVDAIYNSIDRYNEDRKAD
ncbi:hypothetical protein EOM86_11895, partial [Candidatus Nomurabacteria bacterium]|nr:hypothetical protein [Candidatus Nomurabacteria bacterium]